MESLNNIGMGEYKIGHSQGKLHCLGLGSCVGLVLYDTFTCTGAMAHVVLPDCRGVLKYAITGEPYAPAKFANTAVDYLLKKMTDRGVYQTYIRAWLFGGANMFPETITDERLDVGAKNVEVLRAELKRTNIFLVGEDIGGHQGRSVILDLATGDVTVQILNNEGGPYVSTRGSSKKGNPASRVCIAG